MRGFLFLMALAHAVSVFGSESKTETPVWNAEKFIESAAGMEGPASQYWFSKSFRGKKMGFGKVSASRAAEGKGGRAWAFESVMTVETAQGKAFIFTKLDTDLRFRPVSGSWATRGVIAGFGGFSSSVLMEFAWDSEGATVSLRAGDGKETDRIRLDCGSPPVSPLREIIPLLMRGKARHYMFSAIDIADGRPGLRRYLPVSIGGRKQAGPADARMDRVEISAGTETLVFTPQGRFVSAAEDSVTTTAFESEEEASAGIERFVPQESYDWKSRATPSGAVQALVFGMICPDEKLLEDCVAWDEFIASAAGPGLKKGDKPSDADAGRLKAQTLAGLLEQGRTAPKYYLLIAANRCMERMTGEDTAEVESPGSGVKYFMKRIAGAWKIAGWGK